MSAHADAGGRDMRVMGGSDCVNPTQPGVAMSLPIPVSEYELDSLPSLPPQNPCESLSVTRTLAHCSDADSRKTRRYAENIEFIGGMRRPARGLTRPGAAR